MRKTKIDAPKSQHISRHGKNMTPGTRRGRLRDVARLKGEMLVEMDGPGASPEAVDPLVLLPLAMASFRLALKLAEIEGKKLELRGIVVKEKCVALATTPSNVRTAQGVMKRGLRIVRGDEPAPPGTQEMVKELRRQRIAIPSNQSVSMHIGKWSTPMVAPANDAVSAVWETTEMRVVPIHVGGKEPAVWLKSRSESEPFRVGVSEAQARILGSFLYQPIDVELRICRGLDDVITKGTVIDVHKLDFDTDPVEGWRAWFAENASDWNDVKDVLVELGRGD